MRRLLVLLRSGGCATADEDKSPAGRLTLQVAVVVVLLLLYAAFLGLRLGLVSLNLIDLDIVVTTENMLVNAYASPHGGSYQRWVDGACEVCESLSGVLLLTAYVHHDHRRPKYAFGG